MTAALHTELTESLKTLRMPTVKSCYEEEAEAARRESLTYERYLLEIIRRESEQRPSVPIIMRHFLALNLR